MVVRHGQPAAPIEVAVERIRHRGMQRDKPALAELCPPDQQNAVGLQIVEPQVERLRDPQPRRGDQSEECRVHLAPEWVCPSQSAGGRDDLRHLLGRVDVGQRANLWSGKQGCWRHLMGGILGVQEAGEVHDVAQPDVPGAWRRGLGRPGHRG